MAKPRTQPSTPRLSDLAQRVAVPKTAVSTGWPAVAEKCEELGISFRPWQQGAGQIILAKRADGKYATTIGGTGLSIPRQVGKTFLVGAIIFALCLLRPNLTVIWTAHRLRTADETFGKMQAFAKRKTIKAHILKIVLGSGDEEIRFRNGSRILFGARERGFGRGFDEVDVLIFDEAQILTDNALDDMIPATNQSRQETGALLLFMGTPPKPKDPSEVWLRMRSETENGEDEDTAWIEFGADEGFTPTPQPARLTARDWEQVAKANPSFPDDTPREAILRMRKKLGPESFLREGLGIYDDLRKKLLIMPSWPDCATGSPPPEPLCLGLAMDIDRVWLSLGAVGGAEMPHLGSVLRVRVDEGKARMLAEVKRIATERGIPVAVDPKDYGANLIDDLDNLGVTILRPSFDEYVQSCGDVYDAIEAGDAEHGDYADLNAAVAGAGWPNGRQRRVWVPASGEVSMLKAVTLAWWGSKQETTSIYEERGALVL